MFRLPQNPSMRSSDKPRERRLHPRAELRAVATLTAESRRLGPYVVGNLSAGGLSAQGGHDAGLAPGTRVEITVDLEGGGTSFLNGRVARPPSRESGLTIVFCDVAPELEDAIHEAVLAALESRAPAVLIIDGA